MALSTYTELKTAIANWLNRSDLTDEISDDFIKLVESEYNAKLRIKAMLNSKTDYSIILSQRNSCYYIRTRTGLGSVST